MQSRMIVSAAGVLLVGWLPALPPLILPLAAALICWLLRRRCPRSGTTGACFFLGIAYGVAWGHSLLEARLPAALESVALPAEVTVLEPPQVRVDPGRRRQRFAARVELLDCPAVAPDCGRAVGRVLLSYYGDTDLRAGERWRVELRLKRPRGLANPDSFNYESWLSQRRFAATGYIRDRDLLELTAASGHWHQRWRQAVGDRLRQGIDDPAVGGILLALSNGDRSDISPEQWRRIQRYGLNHLVVISGLHVGLVAGLGFLAGRLAGRRSAHAAAALTALAYSALAGFALPTVRALIALACVQLVALAGRRLRPGHSLAAALLGIALVDPLASHGAGFWLSFGAVAWILYLRHMWPDLRPWQLTLVIQLVLSLASGLLASAWFGGLGWVAPLANLVAVPVLGFWLAPLCLLAALLPPLDRLLWELAGRPVQGFLAIDRWLGESVPLWLPVDLPAGALLAGLGALGWLCCHRHLPLRWAAAPILVVALLPWRERAPLQPEFWLLDVGQGLAAVLLAPGFTLVYDTGAGEPDGPNMADSVIAPFLLGRGIDRIDLLVISHGDRDHASGVYTLHETFPVGETWVGEAPFSGLQGQAGCRAGMSRSLPGLRIHVLWPQGGAGEGNNRSCVLRLDMPGWQVLLPGDIETSVEHRLLRARRDELAATVLVVPHHGSRSSSASAFLAAVNPALALNSRGYRNRFGHPHVEVTRRLAIFGLDACETAEQGALRVLADGGGMQVSGWRHKRRFYWSGAASPACAPAYNGAVKNDHKR